MRSASPTSKCRKTRKAPTASAPADCSRSPKSLQVPVAFFFEGLPTLAPHDSSGSALSEAQIDDFVSGSDGLRLIGAFMRIDNAALRRRIVMLVQEIAGDAD